MSGKEIHKVLYAHHINGFTYEQKNNTTEIVYLSCYIFFHEIAQILVSVDRQQWPIYWYIPSFKLLVQG